MRASGAGRIALVPGLACLFWGCAGIGTAELSERSIAIYWYDTETLRKRAEAIEEEDPTTRRKSRAGVANVGDMGRYMGHVLSGGTGRGGPGQSLESRFPGRLALLDPQSEAVTPVEGARTGALPVDWSRDGTRLMFSQLAGRFRQLFEFHPATGEVRRLTRGPGVHSDGCFGPEGRYVFARAQVGADQIVTTVVMTQPGGLDPKPMSEGTHDYGPACAPDGRAVAWVRAGPRGDSLMVRMPPVDGPVRSLGLGRHPSFSADGEWIVYSARSRGKWALFRIRPDGSGRKAVGSGTIDALQPSFSPDGRLVVYVADDGFNRRIYLRRFDGTGDRVLLRSGGGEYPVWRREAEPTAHDG